MLNQMSIVALHKQKNPASAMEAHEALMLFNTHRHDVKAVITVYFSDREPMRDIEVPVPAERVIEFLELYVYGTGGKQQ